MSSVMLYAQPASHKHFMSRARTLGKTPEWLIRSSAIKALYQLAREVLKTHSLYLSLHGQGVYRAPFLNRFYNQLILITIRAKQDEQIDRSHVPLLWQANMDLQTSDH